ncbi:MAG: helix-turn-helix transcriptional regulator [Actinobacteria bacterium]|nr:helix-turn-helix transcriptional regulator [Actinomycetota bacterium]
MQEAEEKKEKGTEFGRFIKQQRKRLNLNQQQASDIAGIHLTQWSTYEAGKSPAGMTIATLGKFAKALRIHPSVLIAVIFKDNPFAWEGELPE